MNKDPDQAKVGDKNIAPTTTAAQDAVPAGQRRINLIWELTQAFVAVSVSTATLAAAVWEITHGRPADGSFLLLSNAFFLVIGFYFGRTNHQRIGGIGARDIGR